VKVGKTSTTTSESRNQQLLFERKVSGVLRSPDDQEYGQTVQNLAWSLIEWFIEIGAFLPVAS
jgi:hypothetical protein